MTILQKMEALRYQRKRSASFAWTPDQQLHYQELLAQRRERVRELVSDGRVISSGTAQANQMAKRKAKAASTTADWAFEEPVS